MKNNNQTKRKLEVGKFADLTLDRVFKLVFCDTNDDSNLILLLNTFLPPEARIDKIKEWKDRVIDADSLGGKTSILDIHCSKENGEEFIVEMQNQAVINNYQRFVSYCAKTYYTKLKKGDILYEGLKPVYMLVFFCNDFLEDEVKGESELVSYLSIMNERTHKIMPLTMKWIFVRLFLMTKEHFEDCTSKEEQCMWLLKNMKHLKSYPRLLESSDYKSFAVSAEIANFGSKKN